MIIRYTTKRTPDLGWLLVAATDRGICFIALDDDPDQLRQELHDRFPGAEQQEAEATFAGTVDRVLACISDPRRPFDLPLDLLGTPFQQRVWQALRQVPPGQTATYRDIATRIGAANAVRAVGSACGANPVAIIVPCHRVVRSDGGLGGFRWGLDRKKALLDREAHLTGS